MAAIALVNYVRFKGRNGSYITNDSGEGYNFQNFTIGNARVSDGITYHFAPFAFNPNSADRGGDRSDCAMVWPLNDIAVNLAEEMASRNRLIEVKTVPLNISDFTDQTVPEPGNPSNEITVVINEELWRVAGYETDTEKVVIRLQTPLDAVLANVPGRVITEELVGALPFESNV